MNIAITISFSIKTNNLDCINPLASTADDALALEMKVEAARPQ